MNLLTLLSSVWLTFPALSINHVGDEAHITVIARTAWVLEATATWTNWVEIARGDAASPPYMGTVTVIRDNALQPMIIYRLLYETTFPL